MLGVGKQNHRFETVVEVFGHLSNGSLILKIASIAHPANQPPCMDLGAKISGEAFETAHTYIVQIRKCVRTPSHSLRQWKHGLLVVVHANGDHHLVEQGGGAAQVPAAEESAERRQGGGGRGGGVAARH